MYYCINISYNKACNMKRDYQVNTPTYQLVFQVFFLLDSFSDKNTDKL